MWNRSQSVDLKTIAAQRICIIKPSALGDIVQTLPLLPALHKRFPDAEISWVVNGQLADILNGHPLLHRVLTYDRRGGIRSGLNLLRELKQANFDLVFDLQGLLRSAVMTKATRAKCCVGLETAREGSHLVCDVVVPNTGRKVPAHARYWEVARAIGMGDFQPVTTVPINKADHTWADALLSDLPQPVVAIHPGAQWRTKRWPVGKFAAVASKMYRAYGYAVIILGSQQEAPLTVQVENSIKQLAPSAVVRNLTGKTTLKQLAALLQRVDMLLSNDSGPMHLAAGLNTPVVGIFTCTSAHRSGPAGDLHELASCQLNCAASYKKRCPHAGKNYMACMEDLQQEQVWRAVVRMIERIPAKSKAA